jgi:hypothetical protein
MRPDDLLRPDDVGLVLPLPAEIERLVVLNLIDLEPWHIMPRDEARTRFDGLRSRYQPIYFPFARRHDNDDIACLDPSQLGTVTVVHDFATAGSEAKTIHETFWDWFRTAIEDMIEF